MVAPGNAVHELEMLWVLEKVDHSNCGSYKRVEIDKISKIKSEIEQVI